MKDLKMHQYVIDIQRKLRRWKKILAEDVDEDSLKQNEFDDETQNEEDTFKNDNAFLVSVFNREFNVENFNIILNSDNIQYTIENMKLMKCIKNANAIFCCTSSTNTNCDSYKKIIVDSGFMSISRGSRLRFLLPATYEKYAIKAYLKRFNRNSIELYCKKTDENHRITINDNEYDIIDNTYYLNSSLAASVIVGDNAHHFVHGFEDFKNLREVTLDPHITSIIFCTFKDCTSLTAIKVLNDEIEQFKLSMIEEYAFKNTAIRNFIIPNSVKRIYQNAFEDCQNLTSLNMPTSLTWLQESVVRNTQVKELSININMISNNELGNYDLSKNNSITKVFFKKGKLIEDKFPVQVNGYIALRSMEKLDSIYFMDPGILEDFKKCCHINLKVYINDCPNLHKIYVPNEEFKEFMIWQLKISRFTGISYDNVIVQDF